MVIQVNVTAYSDKMRGEFCEKLDAHVGHQRSMARLFELVGRRLSEAPDSSRRPGLCIVL
jgi:hypothetical protein